MYWMSDWGWVVMTFMMIFWVVLFGGVIYIAVRLGQQTPRGH
jgi:hypothetical protein